MNKLRKLSEAYPMKTVEMTLKRSVETDSLSGKKKEKDNNAETSLV